MNDEYQSKYRWFILGLITGTGTFVATLPFSCLPPLFKEISDDLGLDLVQVGTVWGFASLAAIFVSLIGGVLGDRFGVKLILGISCLLVGLTGAMRGLSNSFLTLAITVFLNGVARFIVPVNNTKAVGLWFQGKNLGLAMGISAMGMGFGLMLGPMISATIMSPLLGGWRNVMFFYGIISIIVGVIWFVFGREPYEMDSGSTPKTTPIIPALSKSIRIRALWLIGLILMFRVGCIMGMTGYLPLYLRGQGWPRTRADGPLAAFYGVSTLCVVPLSSLSDRIGSRKAILFTALIVTVICFSLLPFVEGILVWFMMIISGIFMDGFMAVIVTMLLESKGVKPEFSGAALGITFTIGQFGGVFSPPIGNSLAAFHPGLPFLFWATLCIIALLFLFPAEETAMKRKYEIT